MLYLCLNGNSLTGPIPSELGNMRLLRTLNLFSNSLTGTVSVSFSNMTFLQTFLLQQNLLTGPLGQAFSTRQRCLTVVDISQNFFSGSIPSIIFQLPVLTSLAMVKNGFGGALPPAICNASHMLQVLALDGLAAASESPIFKGTMFLKYFKKAVTTRRMSGSIPACVFQLPALVNLTMSANGFTGSLPNIQQLSPNLTNLLLPYNKLGGAIPVAFQAFSFLNLTLSYNQFKGSIFGMGSFFTPRSCNGNAGSTGSGVCTPGLYLDVNRLSGNFPSTFYNAANISIVTGLLVVG